MKEWMPPLLWAMALTAAAATAAIFIQQTLLLRLQTG